MSIESFIKRVCVQTAVYWGSPTDDGYGGKTFVNPVEIPCRWEDSTEVISDGKGNQIICRAQVLLTQDVDQKGWLFLGLLTDLTSANYFDPPSVEGAYEIKRFDKTPTFRSTTKFVRKAYL